MYTASNVWKHTNWNTWFVPSNGMCTIFLIQGCYKVQRVDPVRIGTLEALLPSGIYNVNRPRMNCCTINSNILVYLWFTFLYSSTFKNIISKIIYMWIGRSRPTLKPPTPMRRRRAAPGLHRPTCPPPPSHRLSLPPPPAKKPGQNSGGPAAAVFLERRQARSGDSSICGLRWRWGRATAAEARTQGPRDVGRQVGRMGRGSPGPGLGGHSADLRRWCLRIWFWLRSASRRIGGGGHLLRRRWSAGQGWLLDLDPSSSPSRESRRHSCRWKPSHW
jgi:hypothetical protein